MLTDTIQSNGGLMLSGDPGKKLGGATLPAQDSSFLY